ncbi:hypothetical protein Rcae01_04574 [Novipirellula caenicola]|uniref:Uncharacterized protein n=1 Tax=Novipirellula caenicola TaxID=1536901 RepID=A0ABP9VXU9_9BACT
MAEFSKAGCAVHVVGRCREPGCRLKTLLFKIALSAAPVHGMITPGFRCRLFLERDLTHSELFSQ